MRVEFLKKLRDEHKYVDLETLTAAIARDVANAREYFGANGGPAAHANGLINGGASGGRNGFATSATDRIR